jgi:tRNA (guanine-N7-)-methyltransferase
VENLRRTTEHLARIAERQAGLRRSSAEMIGRTPSFTLEIGCGHGHFLTAYAAAFPETVCLGLDIIAERIERAIRKRNRARLTNLHFLHASAEDFLATLPMEARLGDVFVLFPDPWPKRRHHKNRIMQPDFLKALAVFAGPETRLYFRTDDRTYFHRTDEILRADPHWQISADPWAFEHETVFQQRAPEYQSLVARLNPSANPVS